MVFILKPLNCLINRWHKHKNDSVNHIIFIALKKRSTTVFLRICKCKTILNRYSCLQTINQWWVQLFLQLLFYTGWCDVSSLQKPNQRWWFIKMKKKKTHDVICNKVHFMMIITFTCMHYSYFITYKCTLSPPSSSYTSFIFLKTFSRF